MAAADSGELLTIKLRYKRPAADRSELMTRTVRDAAPGVEASADLRWAAAVACFGMLLRDSEHKGNSTLALANELARGALGAIRTAGVTSSSGCSIKLGSSA